MCRPVVRERHGVRSRVQVRQVSHYGGRAGMTVLDKRATERRKRVSIGARTDASVRAAAQRCQT